MKRTTSAKSMHLPLYTTLLQCKSVTSCFLNKKFVFGFQPWIGRRNLAWGDALGTPGQPAINLEPLEGATEMLQIEHS